MGPKLGMTLLSQLGQGSPAGRAEEKRTWPGWDAGFGVGKKLAERLAVELSDKALKMAAGSQSESLAQGLSGEGEEESKAVQALISLGFSSQQAKLAVSRAYQSLGSKDKLKVEDIVKLALKLV